MLFYAAEIVDVRRRRKGNRLTTLETHERFDTFPSRPPY